MLNQAVMEYWSYGENGDGFGMPRSAFFPADPTDDIQRLLRAGRSDSVKWGRSDLKLGMFQFSDLLDCTDCAEINNLHYRLCLQQSFKSRYWVHTPTISFWHQLRDTRYISTTKEPRLTLRSELTESDSRYPLRPGKGGPHPITLGDDFPYEPGDLVHFLGPRGCIGQGYILSKSGKDYCVAHSGTQISSSSKDYISPTRKSFSLKAALCPMLNTIKCRDNLKFRFQLGTK